MDYTTFCRHFYASHYLPISYFEAGLPVCGAGFPAGVFPYQRLLPKLLDTGRDPTVFTAEDSGVYGAVRCAGTGGYLVLGPAFSGDLSEEAVRSFLGRAAVPPEREKEMANILFAIPHYTYNRFLNLLCFLHLMVNGEEISITEHFAVAELGYEAEIAARHVQKSFHTQEEQHGTYLFEQQMLEFVRRGDTERMRDFLLTSVQREALTEGKLADEPLRQAKNLLIGGVTMIGKSGAIPGGMDIEQAYQLIDLYIQECEHLRSVDEVKNLQFNMLIDFTARVGQAKKPPGLSPEVYRCMQYISLHLSEPICLDDVAAQIGRSRAYITARFRREANCSILEYITACRLEEAKMLLNYTDRSVSEISDYLCFANQPYFSNVFRKRFGMSPVQYRKRRAAE